jgi:8-oxo-dGTP diphosphatase
MLPSRTAAPLRPLLGVSVLVWRRRKVLLVRRGHQPLKGMWSLPGGLVEAGERLAEAAAREVLEETAITVGDLTQVDQAEIIGCDPKGAVAYHYVLAVFAGPYRSGTIRAGDDSADARWVAKSALAGLPLTDDTERVIRAHAPE